MFSLLSRDQGDLDQRVEISVIDGEEHYRRKESILLESFMSHMAHWLLGSPHFNEIEPSDDIVVAALMKHKDKWCYWPTGTNADTKGFLQTVYPSLHLRTEDESRKIVHATQLAFFNPAREHDAKIPIAKIRFHAGYSSMLYDLDCSMNEAASLLHAIRGCNLSVKTDVYTEAFLTYKQVRKTPSTEVAKSEKAYGRKAAIFGKKNPEPNPDAALIRKLQSYRI